MVITSEETQPLTNALSTTATTTSTEVAHQDDVVHHDVEEADSTISRVVAISLDPSQHSRYAFQWSCDNFINPKTDLVVLLHSRPIATVPGPYGSMYIDFTEYISEVEEQVLHYSFNLSHRFPFLSSLILVPLSIV
jgi:hypothetical protein